MASQGQRDDQSPGVAVKAPHFFKIILADSLRHGKLMIPRRFVRKHGEGLSNLAFLYLPNGAEWKLELTRCDGEIWLQKGWQEFLEYYSVKPGHFLVFRYEGNSRFHLLIFDTSATEIDYPAHSSQVKGKDFGEKLQVSPKEETENDSSVEILDSFRTYKRREKLPCDPRPQKMKRTNPSAKTEKICNLPKWVPHSTPNRTQSKEVKPKKLKAQGNLHPTKKEFQGVEGISTNEVGCPKSEVLTRTRPLTSIEKARALKEASRFKRENPYFMVVMQPSYVQFGWRLNIPLKFAKTYLNKTLGDVVLRVSDGRNWPVKYRAGKFLCWKEFSLGNNLKVGDVCVFELIKGIKVSFKVVIFRANEEQCPLSPGGLYFSSKGEGGSMPKSPIMCFQSHIFRSKKRTATEKARALERAIAFNSQNPFFMVSMCTPYAYGRSNLHIPCKFAEKYLSDQKPGNVILLVSGGKTWPVQYIYRDFGSCRNTELSIGWRAFARDNKLEEGDVCVFELMKGIGVTNSHQSLGKRSERTGISKQQILKLIKQIKPILNT